MPKGCEEGGGAVLRGNGELRSVQHSVRIGESPERRVSSQDTQARAGARGSKMLFQTDK